MVLAKDADDALHDKMREGTYSQSEVDDHEQVGDVEPSTTTTSDDTKPKRIRKSDSDGDDDK